MSDVICMTREDCEALLTRSRKDGEEIARLRAELEKAQGEAASWRRTLETMTAERDAANARAEAAEALLNRASEHVTQYGSISRNSAMHEDIHDFVRGRELLSHWVSVNDRLPDDDVRMLYVSNGDSVYRMHPLAYQQPETRTLYPWWIEAVNHSPPAPPAQTAEDA